MRIAIILNGISLNKKTFQKKMLPALREKFQVDVFETQSKNDAVLLASKAANKKYAIILAAGGDGTIHQVVNGMLRDCENPERLPVLGVIPLGSGNDLARSFGLQKTNLFRTIDAIQKGKYAEIDIGEIWFSKENTQEKRFFINVVDTGMGPIVVKKVLNSGRALGSSIAYFSSIISTFFSYKPVMLHARCDDWEWHDTMRTFAVGNGKYYGNGLCVCPDAKQDDNLLDIFACGAVSVLDFIVQSVPLKQGKKVKHKKVSYARSREIKLWSDEQLEIEADGEILGVLPATVKLSGMKIRMLMG